MTSRGMYDSRLFPRRRVSLPLLVPFRFSYALLLLPLFPAHRQLHPPRLAVQHQVAIPGREGLRRSPYPG